MKKLKNILENLNSLEIYFGVVALLCLLFISFLAFNQLFGTKQTEAESYTVSSLETEQRRRFNGKNFFNYILYWCFAENEDTDVRFAINSDEYNKIKSGDVITIQAVNKVGRWLKIQSTQYFWNERNISESITITRKDK